MEVEILGCCQRKSNVRLGVGVVVVGGWGWGGTQTKLLRSTTHIKSSSSKFFICRNLLESRSILHILLIIIT